MKTKKQRGRGGWLGGGLGGGGGGLGEFDWPAFLCTKKSQNLHGRSAVTTVIEDTAVDE